MGRGKVKMELIGNEKSRKLTFKKRKEGLIKKLHELTTLCDVSACMIISEAAPTNQEPVDIWPQNPEKVQRIIESYKAKRNDPSSSCTKLSACGLSDFFRDRQKKVEEELAQLRRRNLEEKYPIHHEILNTLTEAQLREFHAALVNKAEIAKSRIEFLKMSAKQEFFLTDFAAPHIWNLDGQETAASSVNHHHHHHHQNDNSVMMMDFAPERLVSLDMPHDLYANWNIQDQEITGSLDQHPQNCGTMMMVMMNENDSPYFDQHYYGSLDMIPEYYMAAPMMEAAILAPPQLQYWESNGDHEEDISQYFSDSSFWS